MGKIKNGNGLTPFGRWVKTQALNRDIELQEIAGQVGISKNYLSAILHGNRPGNRYKLPLVKALGGDVCELRDII